MPQKNLTKLRLGSSTTFLGTEKEMADEFLVLGGIACAARWTYASAGVYAIASGSNFWFENRDMVFLVRVQRIDGVYVFFASPQSSVPLSNNDQTY
jgi:hypothetical protein